MSEQTTATPEHLYAMSATTLAAAVRRKDLSPVEITEAILDRVEQLNPELNAYCLVAHGAARRAAAAAEASVMRGDDLGSLHGVPYSLKDLTHTAGMRTTFGSKLFADHVPSEDAIIAERMSDAGGILIGKTNTPDHGCKAVTDNLLFGATRNPWNTALTPGGSSGGAAAAVAAGLAPLAEGSDYAGSIRIPAAHCGLVGFKPSDGRIPVYPEPMPFHPVAFNHGPITRTVADAALMLQVMSGPDERDPRSLAASSENFLEAVQGDLSMRGQRIGWLGNLGFAPVDQAVMDISLHAVSAFEELGAEVEIVAIGNESFSDAEEAYNLPNASRRAGLLEHHLADRRADLDPLLVRRIESAVSHTAADAARAGMLQGRIYHQVRTLFEKYDLLALPTVPTPAFELGVNAPASVGGRLITPLELIVLTYIFNMTGHPAVSVPAGWTENGLPIGLQLVGPRQADARLLRAAAAFEQARPWASRWPEIAPQPRS